jgi:hypothetical protein
LALLWSRGADSAEEKSPPKLELTYQWLSHHVVDVAQVLLMNGDLTKQIFIEIENAAKTNTTEGLRIRKHLIDMLDLPAIATLNLLQ